MNIPIYFTTEIWKEGGSFVAWAPEFDVSSMGGSVDEARMNLREAAGLFLEEAEKMGTLQEILEEGGYVRASEGWKAPELLAIEKTSVAVA